MLIAIINLDNLSRFIKSYLQFFDVQPVTLLTGNSLANYHGKLQTSCKQPSDAGSAAPVISSASLVS